MSLVGIETMMPLHCPPAPLATGAVANGESMLTRVPGVMFCGPAALPHQLQVATRVLAGTDGPVKVIGVKYEVKSLEAIVRLLAAAEVLSSCRPASTLETTLLAPVTSAPPPDTRIPAAALLIVFPETFTVVALPVEPPLPPTDTAAPCNA